MGEKSLLFYFFKAFNLLLKVMDCDSILYMCIQLTFIYFYPLLHS